MAEEEVISPEENQRTQENKENQEKQKTERLPVSELLQKPIDNHLKIILFASLGLVFAGGLVYGGYLLGQKQVQPGLQIAPTPVVTPTPEAPANWKIYINNLNNYSIEYPSNKLTRLICPGEELTLVPRVIGDQDPIEMPSCAREGRYIIEILTLQKPVTYPKADQYNFVEEDEVIVNGIRGKRYVVTEFIPPPMGPLIVRSMEIFVDYKNKTYNFFLSLQDEEINDIFNQILSTFKFLERANGERVDCLTPKPEVCTMECITNPPYICGSDGESYCSECQACSNQNVEWYITQSDPCGI